MSSARRLRDRRIDAGLTQAQLAEAAGVSRALVSSLEAGRHLPRIDAALGLARVLGTSAEQLFGPGGATPLDVITGLPPAAGSPVRVGLVGGQPVTTPARHGDTGWQAVDWVSDGRGDALAERPLPGVVVSGCEPALALLEGLLRDRGTRAMAVMSTSAAALAALAAGRLHAAAVHFPEGVPPADGARPLQGASHAEGSSPPEGARLPAGAPLAKGAPLPEGPPLSLATAPVTRLRLARWRVGLSAPPGARARLWQAALSGRSAVIQREPEAAAQQAFERARRSQRHPADGPRVESHLAAGRRCMASGLPAVTIEPAAAAVGADFHPLETHEVELWVRTDRLAEPPVQRLLDLLTTAHFRRTLDCIGGYDLSRLGTTLS